MRPSTERCVVASLVLVTAACARGDVPTGELQGIARLFGASDHAGIEILAEGAGARGQTESDGSYVLRGVRAGNRVLRFRHPGYVEERIQNVPVAPGVYDLPPVVLTRGQPVLPGDGVRLRLMSPTQDRALVTLADDILYLVDLTTSSATPVSEQPPFAGYVYAETGEWLAFTQGFDAELIWYDVASRTTHSLGTLTSSVTASADGRRLAAVVNDLGGSYSSGDLYLWDVTQRRGGIVTGPVAGDTPQLSPDGAYVVYRLPYTDSRDATIQVLEVASETIDTLAANTYVRDVVIHPSGQNFLFWDNYTTSTASMDLRLWDLAARSSTLIEVAARPGYAEYAPDGHAFAFLHTYASSHGTLEVVDLPGLGRAVVSTGAYTSYWTWAPNSDAVHFMESYSIGNARHRIWTPTGTSTVHADADINAATWSGDGSALWLVADGELLVWDLAQGAVSQTLTGVHGSELIPTASADVAVVADSLRLTAWDVTAAAGGPLLRTTSGRYEQVGGSAARPLLAFLSSVAVFGETDSLVIWDLADRVEHVIAPNVSRYFGVTPTNVLFVEEPIESRRHRAGAYVVPVPP